MNLLEAAEKRISNRAYTDQLVEPEKLEALQSRIDEINAREGLHFQLIGPSAENGYAAIMERRLFATDVKYCIACMCTDDMIEREKIGFFGEELVLLATQLGLGSCWVASTYKKETVAFELGEGEDVVCIITLGYVPDHQPLKQAGIRTGLRARTKKPAQIMAGDAADAPEWFAQAIDCVLAGPTAVNCQPTVFTWENGEVRADLVNTERPVHDVDFGICKYHFMLGSGLEGTWEWGRGGKYVVAQ